MGRTIKTDLGLIEIDCDRTGFVALFTPSVPIVVYDEPNQARALAKLASKLRSMANTVRQHAMRAKKEGR